MKNLILLTMLILLIVSCATSVDNNSKQNEEKSTNENSAKEYLNDINELCKCGRDIRLGKNIQECAKTQEDIRNKYKKNNDQLTKLDKKVMDCVEEALKNK